MKIWKTKYKSQQKILNPGCWMQNQRLDMTEMLSAGRTVIKLVLFTCAINLSSILNRVEPANIKLYIFTILLQNLLWNRKIPARP